MTYKEWFDAHGAKHQKIMKNWMASPMKRSLPISVLRTWWRKNPSSVHFTKKIKNATRWKSSTVTSAPVPTSDSMTGVCIEKEGRTYYSDCNIHAREGKAFVSESAVHQDCSACLLPHKESFVRKVFTRNWFGIMRGSDASQYASTMKYSS